MPNWCAGTLRVRGNKENVIKFIKKCFIVCEYSSEEENPNVHCGIKASPISERIDLDKLEEGWDYKHIKMCVGGYIHVVDKEEDIPTRAFIEWDRVPDLDVHEFLWMDYDDSDKVLVIFPIQQAWGFNSEEWLMLAQKYNVDMHLFGWECGMCFDNEIEIIDGKITKDIPMTESDDWYWDAANPFTGG